VRTLLNGIETFVVWALFFAMTVYGHTALKLAAGDGGAYDYRRALGVLADFRGWTAMLAWTLSGLVWTVLLTRNSLLAANSISAFRYVLICLAAWLVLDEKVRAPHVIGIAFIAAGISLLNR
jgi:multidrug transporter EmrE-like cation transporter